MDINAMDNQIQETQKKIADLKEILKDPDNQELFVLAEQEIKELEEKEKHLSEQSETQTALAPSSVIMEIRAGTGGDEAALFAGNLFEMYSRYAQEKNWKQKILDSHGIELGGYKEIVFELTGSNVWQEMKNEAGVHRVQRIPRTEKNGRVHTSTASVAVLLKPKKTEFKIKPDSLRIDIFRSSGPGGQNVNKRETAIRITHIPSGIVVASQTQRNQLQNKENAMAILEARLLEKKQREEEERVGGNRNAQIGSAKRAEKIRTYNFPQDRITDHRIKKSWHDIEKIMSGKMEKIIKSLNKK
jgi:peptide chain release factor 1